MKRIILMLFILALILSLLSCSPYSMGKYEFDPGETLSPEMLDSIFGDSNDTEEPPETTVMEINDSTEVYYTDGGSKYHFFLDCQSLSRSTNVKTSTLGNYDEHKKDECCKYCAKRANISDSPAEST